MENVNRDSVSPNYSVHKAESLASSQVHSDRELDGQAQVINAFVKGQHLPASQPDLINNKLDRQITPNETPTTTLTAGINDFSVTLSESSQTMTEETALDLEERISGSINDMLRYTAECVNCLRQAEIVVDSSTTQANREILSPYIQQLRQLQDFFATGAPAMTLFNCAPSLDPSQTEKREQFLSDLMDRMKAAQKIIRDISIEMYKRDQEGSEDRPRRITRKDLPEYTKRLNDLDERMSGVIMEAESSITKYKEQQTELLTLFSETYFLPSESDESIEAPTTDDSEEFFLHDSHPITPPQPEFRTAPSTVRPIPTHGATGVLSGEEWLLNSPTERYKNCLAETTAVLQNSSSSEVVLVSLSAHYGERGLEHLVSDCADDRAEFLRHLKGTEDFLSRSTSDFTAAIKTEQKIIQTMQELIISRNQEARSSKEALLRKAGTDKDREVIEKAFQNFGLSVKAELQALQKLDLLMGQMGLVSGEIPLTATEAPSFLPSIDNVVSCLEAFTNCMHQVLTTVEDTSWSENNTAPSFHKTRQYNLKLALSSMMDVSNRQYDFSAVAATTIKSMSDIHTKLSQVFNTLSNAGGEEAEEAWSAVQQRESIRKTLCPFSRLIRMQQEQKNIDSILQNMEKENEYLFLNKRDLLSGGMTQGKRQEILAAFEKIERSNQKKKEALEQLKIEMGHIIDQTKESITAMGESFNNLKLPIKQEEPSQIPLATENPLISRVKLEDTGARAGRRSVTRLSSILQTAQKPASEASALASSAVPIAETPLQTIRFGKLQRKVFPVKDFTAEKSIFVATLASKGLFHQNYKTPRSVAFWNTFWDKSKRIKE